MSKEAEFILRTMRGEKPDYLDGEEVCSVCSGCGWPIYDYDEVMSCGENDYHERCFNL